MATVWRNELAIADKFGTYSLQYPTYGVTVGNTTAGNTLEYSNANYSLSTPTLDNETPVKLHDEGNWNLTIGDWTKTIAVTTDSSSDDFNISYEEPFKTITLTHIPVGTTIYYKDKDNKSVNLINDNWESKNIAVFNNATQISLGFPPDPVYMTHYNFTDYLENNILDFNSCAIKITNIPINDYTVLYQAYSKNYENINSSFASGMVMPDNNGSGTAIPIPMKLLDYNGEYKNVTTIVLSLQYEGQSGTILRLTDIEPNHIYSADFNSEYIIDLGYFTDVNQL